MGGFPKGHGGEDIPLSGGDSTHGNGGGGGGPPSGGGPLAIIVTIQFILIMMEIYLGLADYQIREEDHLMEDHLRVQVSLESNHHLQHFLLGFSELFQITQTMLLSSALVIFILIAS